MSGIRAPSVADLLRTTSLKCSLGCPILDRTLSGGIPTRLVTEIVGESTTAKTQLCLQLSLTVQAPIELGGLRGSALYIHTESPAPVARLRSMAEARWRYQLEQAVEPSEALEHIFIEKVLTSAEDLFETLTRAGELMARQADNPSRIRLLVVDSISNLFRDLDVADATDLSERSNLLYRIARLLKEYAYVYDVAVVVTNHVMDCVDLNAPSTKATIPFPYLTSGRPVMPALGLYWGSSLNLRIFLSRHEASDHLKGPARRLQVLFAPNLPLVECEFSVDTWGLHA